MVILPQTTSVLCAPISIACLQLPFPLAFLPSCYNYAALLADLSHTADPWPDMLSSSVYGNDMVQDLSPSVASSISRVVCVCVCLMPTEEAQRMLVELHRMPFVGALRGGWSS